MDAPLGSGHPEITTRVGSPSVWESMTVSSCMDPRSSAAIRQTFANQGADHFPVVAGKLEPRGTDRGASHADLLLHELDQLDELGNGIEPQQRQEPFVERPRRF